MSVAAAASAALTATLFGVQAVVLPPQPEAVAAGTGASTGTLDLRLGAQGAGFDQRVVGLVPGDVVNRYVVLRNAGTLGGRGLSLSVAATPRGPLTADGPGTRALRASVSLCSGGTWSSTSGACSGVVTSLLAPLPLNALAAGRGLAISQVRPGQVLSLRVTLQLPEQDERAVNGRLPRNTVQGHRTALSWTFREQQAGQPD
jgi:hypothetical protein